MLKKTLLISVAIAWLGSAFAADVHPKPKRVLIVVFDQMRPEYAQKFDMSNVQLLQAEGVNFKNAYLGHMPSETVISHNVMVSGVLPKHMGWVDEVYRDTDNVLGKGADAIWITGELKPGEFDALVTKAAYPKLVDYLHQSQPGRKFIVVGEKSYPVDSIAAPNADIAVKMSGRTKVSQTMAAKDPHEASCDNLGGQFRRPDGKNVPSYLTEPRCGRFYVNSDKSNAYGTDTASPSWLYPLDGNRYVPGNDLAHLGGDAWVADTAMEMMEKEDWSGMLITFGSIDKAGHMWGASHDSKTGQSEQTHLPFIAHYADEQFGRVLSKLKELHQLDETLIVITSDHGSTYAEKFFGVDAADASDDNWYHGKAANAGPFEKRSAALDPLYSTNNIRFSYQSTAIEAWLVDASVEKRREAAIAMRSVPGVVASYWRDGSKYVLDTANKGTDSVMSAAEEEWWGKHGQELVDTMAADSGPEVIGWLKDGVGYGVYGDHGSGKESDQRVPMVIWSKYINSEQPIYALRTVDILPTVLQAMGIQQAHPGDGKPYLLNFH
ncbi:MAG: alkaline phosphatase family protein [Paucibacter sp.]|nr:alkaline phosphatase family protein [Roseateles sp.]